MRQWLYGYRLWWGVLLSSSLAGHSSFVYNLRISETTLLPWLPRDVVAMSDRSVVAVTAVDTLKIRYNTLHENACGGLLTYIYRAPSWYAKLDFAFARESVTYQKSINTARMETDDLLLTGGYGGALTEHLSGTISGLIGIPTHSDRELLAPQFGTGHVGLGVQLDGSLRVPCHETHAVQAAARCIHFITESTPFRLPIALPDRALPAGALVSADVHLGDLVDLFVGYHVMIQRHSVNIGWNGSYLLNAYLSSYLAQLIPDLHYVRTSFYANYRCRFMVHEHLGGIGVGFSYGFDTQRHPLSNKRIISTWVAGGISF